jgi:ATP-dependent DNA helicase PIF1
MINFTSGCISCSATFDPAEADSTLKIMSSYNLDLADEKLGQDALCSRCLIKKERELDPAYLQKIRNAVDDGLNICCVGAAGSGKSIILKKISQQLRFKSPPIIFEVLCPTGCSAVNVDGITLHSLFCWSSYGKSAHGFGQFFGMSCSALAGGKISNENVEEKLLKPMPRYRAAVKRIKELGAMFFDEFSMISGEHLKAMDRIAKAIKGDWSKPFGGIQILMFGDPFQNLPPRGKAPFSSPVWKSMNLNIFEIQASQLYRFTTMEFSDMTRMLRLGIVSEAVEARFMTRAQEPSEKIMELYFTNKDVEVHNLSRYTDLKTEEYTYPSSLELRVTTLHENKDKQLISSRPISISAPNTKKFSLDQFSVLENKKQILKLANEQLEQYRRILSTVYGAEYMEMKFKPGCRVICTVNNKENGKLLYCNGSAGIIQTCSKEGAVLLLDDGRKIKVEYKVIESCRRIRLEQSGFVDLKLCFSHIPFRLGYAITFNRSQGLTLNTVKVNGRRLKKTTGMLYVGISRCRSLEDMYLDGISLSKIKASSEALIIFQDHVTSELRHLHSARPDWFARFQVQSDDQTMLQKFIELIHCVKTGSDIVQLDKNNEKVEDGSLTVSSMPNFEAGNKTQLTKVRNQSQRELRKWLIKHQAKCLITGETLLSALDVAHIKPYSEFTEEELKLAHTNNGMLMRKDLHALYDKGYFAIEGDGKILKSKSFSLSESYTQFEYVNLEVFMSREHLQWHREHVFKVDL